MKKNIYIKPLAFLITCLCVVSLGYAQCGLETATWDGANWNWSGATPQDTAPTILATSNVIIDGNYNTNTGGIQTSFSACNLTINATYTLSIDNGDYVEVQDDIIANGNITVETQGAVVQIDDSGSVTGTGTITVIKTTAPSDVWYEYTYWSSPVSGITISEGLTDAEPDRRFLFNAENYLDATAEIGNNNATDPGRDDIDDDGNAWQPVTDGTTMDPGVGYASTQSEFSWSIAPGTSNKSFDYTFVGSFNNGIYNVPVYRNDSETNDINWNLIGNPYPSAIDADLFLAANSVIDVNVATTKSLDGAIFLWSQNTAPSGTANGNQVLNFSSDDYAIINGVGQNAGGEGVIPNRFIPSGQAFFVALSDAATVTNVSGNVYTANVIFNNAMRVKGASDNSQFFKGSTSKSKSSSISNKLWVNVTSDNGVFNQVLIGYVNGATNSDDGMYFDAPKNLSSSIAALLYTTIEESSKKFAIQGKAPNDLSEGEIISLGFSTHIKMATLYTLSIAQLQGGFLNNNPVYLKDNLLNQTHDLSASDYTFTSEVGEFNSRFQIGFNAQALSTDEFDLDENKLSIVELENDNIQFAVSNNSSIESIAIFDMLGRQMYGLKGQSSSETYKLSNLNNSIFIAKVKLSNGAIITKKAIKK